MKVITSEQHYEKRQVNISTFMNFIWTSRNNTKTTKTKKTAKKCNKGSYMNCWEQKYIQEYHRSGKLITEQQTYEYNPLFAIAQERNKGIGSVITRMAQQ